MFGRMMNSYYYGKSGKGDYSKRDLPENRKQLFFEMLRVRIAGLFRLNLLAVIAFLPMMYVLVNLFSNTLSLVGIFMDVEADMAAATPEYLDIYNNRAQALYNVAFMALLQLAPCIAITGPIQAGMAYVTRNWARDEHAFVWSDFKDALKSNWKQALGISLITGIVPFTMLLCWQFYGGMAKTSPLFVIPQVLTMTLGVVWFLGLTFAYPMMVSYEMKFGQLVKNSLLLAIGRLPQTVLVRLIMLVPAILASVFMLFTPWGLYAVMVLGGYYVFLGNALARFVYASFTNSVFDRYINSRIEGASVNRGLINPEDRDDDDEDDEETAPAFAGSKDTIV
ncbi:MAG: DUF624 domain-containing protein [Eubacteriales bacterium]|jgi:uncharacterized membrane protein YesL|nr:DUF624 domain-containing protein [Eubacteriales bacterium]MDD4105381.1 DUF624 domain-containing protein [Eubacteriales bacterium]MDD4709872.1 DUF624 domain-containing protein [Eubacteriales bacterium]NLO15351.1 DUF624 domain-containing protein [Clostridiales bacterium]